MVVLIFLVERALERLVPQSGFARSMDGIQWMFGPDGEEGGVDDRDVP